MVTSSTAYLRYCSLLLLCDFEYVLLNVKMKFLQDIKTVCVLIKNSFKGDYSKRNQGRATILVCDTPP